MRNRDEAKEVNRYVRSKNIIEKNSTNFNIITGESKAITQQQIPEKLRNRVEKKYQDKQ